MSKETLELEIKVLIEKARKNTQDISADIKRLCTEAKRGESDTKQLATAMQKINGDAMKRTAVEAKLFGQNLGNLKQQQALVKNAMVDMVSNGITPEAEAIRKLRDEYDKLGLEIKEVEKQSPQQIGSFGDLKNAITGTAGALALLKAASVVKGAGSFALDTADTFKTAREEFGILLNDMQAGAGLFDEIKKFNDLTPFDLDTTKQATKLLLTAKVPLSDINTMLTRMGDLSQGNAQRMVSFASAYSKAAAKGKADMEVLNVYIDQGVPILDAFAKKFKVASGEIVDMVSKGKVSFRDFNDTLADLTAKGGQYFGGMELASKSYKAMQEGLKESVNSLAASFGSMLLPAATKFVGTLSAITNAINNSPVLKGVLATALVAISGYLVIMAAKTTIAFLAQMKLNLAIGALNPVVLGATLAVAAIVGGLTVYAAKQQEAAKASNAAALATRTHADAMYDLAKATAEYKSHMEDDSLARLEKTVKDYTAILAGEQAAIKRAQDALDNMPQTIQTKKRYGGGMKTVSIENPEYIALQKTITEAQERKFEAQAVISAAQERINELKNAEEKRRDFGTEWQDKNLMGLEKIAREKAKAIEALAKKAQQSFEGDYTQEAAYKKELAALKAYYQKQIDEYNQKPLFTAGWVQKNADNISRLKAELDKAREELDKAAKKSLGENFKTNETYIKEKAALELYYQKQIAEIERKNILDAHNKRMNAAKEEAEFRRAQALNKIEGGERTVRNYTDYAQADAQTKVSGTDVGKLFMGADPITMFISSLIEAAMKLENVGKLLNFIGTMTETLVSVIGPLLDGAAKDFVDYFQSLAKALGEILTPFLTFSMTGIKIAAALYKQFLALFQPMGKILLWLNNEVFVPFGNFVINMVNSLINLLNKIPGVNIEKIGLFQKIGKEAEDIAAAMEKHKDQITKMYERQKSRVQDELNAQISSLKKQYELGLINRDEYNRQAEEYGKAADDKLYDINKEMADTLKKIDANTYNALSAEQQQQAQKSYAKEWGDKVPILGHLAGAVVDIGKKIGDGIKSGWEKLGGWLGWWDEGSWDIPQTQLGMVHPGEIIIPKPFAQGIREGKLSLNNSAAQSGSMQGTPVYNKRSTQNRTDITVNLTVEGSVKTEKDLVQAIYDGIAGAIGTGELSPLPQSA